MIRALFETTINDFASNLVQKDQIFRRIFLENSDWLFIDEEQKKLAKEIFDAEKKKESLYEHMTLEEFVEEWKRATHAAHGNQSTHFNHEEDADCAALSSGKQSIFEARTGRYKSSIPIVRPPLGRGRPAEFNAYNFILESESQQTGIPLDLKFEFEEENFFEEIEDDECDTFQETLNATEYADNNLRYIAQIVAILNSKKNGYPVLDLCGETHLHIT